MTTKKSILFLFIALFSVVIVSCNKKIVPVKPVAVVKKEKALTMQGPVIAVGESYCGGIIFYVDSTGKHGLISPGRQVLHSRWGCMGVSVPGTSSEIGAGKKNTEAILKVCSESNSAARVCDDLVLNGYNDWYLPSEEELNALYSKRKYFKGIETNYYWSSTEGDDGGKSAECQDFYDGHKLQYEKTNHFQVRAIRSF